jgi:hypothetical protein
MDVTLLLMRVGIALYVGTSLVFAYGWIKDPKDLARQRAYSITMVPACWLAGIAGAVRGNTIIAVLGILFGIVLTLAIGSYLVRSWRHRHDAPAEVEAGEDEPAE